MLFVWILYTAILKIRTEPVVRESAKRDPIILRLSVYPDITADEKTYLLLNEGGLGATSHVIE